MKEIFYKHTTRYNNKMRSVSILLYGIRSITSLSHFLPECIYLRVYLLQKYESLLVHRQYVLSCFSHVQLFMTPCTADHQAPVSMEFSRQVYQELNPLMSPALAGRFFTTSATWDHTP
ncbi:unnamed protein product [Rangifer tarandus platyrhynchus]|uniref:Uncharacterized protein n=2 Tax=Rangifer tarandus platyrhynchus TaxID=3082113 RepID=A0AC59Y2D1_RANTA|nr:unnamed protein product [Rangifer tarandus platyrhynchus]